MPPTTATPPMASQKYGFFQIGGLGASTARTGPRSTAAEAGAVVSVVTTWDVVFELEPPLAGGAALVVVEVEPALVVGAGGAAAGRGWSDVSTPGGAVKTCGVVVVEVEPGLVVKICCGVGGVLVLGTSGSAGIGTAVGGRVMIPGMMPGVVAVGRRMPVAGPITPVGGLMMLTGVMATTTGIVACCAGVKTIDPVVAAESRCAGVSDTVAVMAATTGVCAGVRAGSAVPTELACWAAVSRTVPDETAESRCAGVSATATGMDGCSVIGLTGIASTGLGAVAIDVLVGASAMPRPNRFCGSRTGRRVPASGLPGSIDSMTCMM